MNYEELAASISKVALNSIRERPQPQISHPIEPTFLHTVEPITATLKNFLTEAFVEPISQIINNNDLEGAQALVVGAVKSFHPLLKALKIPGEFSPETAIDIITNSLFKMVDGINITLGDLCPPRLDLRGDLRARKRYPRFEEPIICLSTDPIDLDVVRKLTRTDLARPSLLVTPAYPLQLKPSLRKWPVILSVNPNDYLSLGKFTRAFGVNFKLRGRVSVAQVMRIDVGRASVCIHGWEQPPLKEPLRIPSPPTSILINAFQDAIKADASLRDVIQRSRAPRAQVFKKIRGLKGNGPPLGPPHSDGGEEGRESERKLEVSVCGNIVAGERITLTAIVRIDTSSRGGDFTKQFKLNTNAGPVSFRLEQSGFELLSSPIVEIGIPEHQDSTPVAFLLKVLSPQERKLTLSLFQNGSLLTQLMIKGNDLRGLARTQNLIANQGIDLTLTITENGNVVADSPSDVLGYSFLNVGKLAKPSEILILKLRNQLKRLHEKANLEEVDRELRIIGHELSGCFSPDLRRVMTDRRIRTILIRHPSTLWFPFELVTLENIQGDQFFLGDELVVTRWLTDLDNTPSDKMKVVRSAAIMHGPIDQELVNAEISGLNAFCEAISYQTFQQVVDNVLKRNYFQLLHFYAHSGNDKEAGLHIQLSDKPLRMTEIDAIPAERRFFECSPLIVINGCSTTRVVPTFYGRDSFHERFLRRKVPLCLCTLWPVEATVAHEFSKHFYGNLRNGSDVGEALNKTKKDVGSSPADNATENEVVWRRISARSYCLYAHPSMKVQFQANTSSGRMSNA